MYHCHVHFYFIGRQEQIWEGIKGIIPLAHFTHTFSTSVCLEEAAAAKADVILADVKDIDGKDGLLRLLDVKKETTELILLADKEKSERISATLPGEALVKIKDIWTLPMSEPELGFRFQRWQQSYKMGKDFWETSQFFEATINHIPNLVWYKDKDGIHEKVNDSFCKTVGKTKQQVEGQGHAYIWDVEEDDPACIESEQEVMSKEKTLVSEEIIKTGEGLRTLTTYKSPLYDLDNSIMGTVGVAIDVTQERAYEEEIVKKNQTLERIFSTLDCGIISHTLDGKHIVNINEAALKILGYESQEELMAEKFELIAPSVVEEDREMFRKAFRKLKAENDNVNVEYRVRHKTGEILHVMGNIKLIKENGELIYRRFLLDCTAQRIEEQRKERQQAELIHALCIDYTLVCFFDLDTGLGFLLRSEGENKQLFDSAFDGEIALQESMGLYIEKFVYEEDKEVMRKALSSDKLKAELAEKTLYCVNYRIGGGEDIKYFQMRAVRAGAWGGNYGIVMGFCNVDSETRNEMEQKNLLEQALQQANRASKAKSVFLSNMSHDIRTPMNAIVGFTSLAISHIEQREQVEEYLKKIMMSGNHLLSLINDVLDMSRIESGKMHLEEKLCCLPDILHGLHNILQSDIHAKRLELQIDAVDVLHEEIYCDKLRLNQVLLNLLSNAVKYTGAGGIVSMRITEKHSALEGYASYEFCIQDTGIGMSEEFVTHIFEPFEREKNSTISGIQGTGLGMAITKNIVDMMNGTISVKSEQGVGTEVLVSFAFRLHTGAVEAKDIPELKGCRALVVDDDYNTCDSVSYMLGQIGMRAEWTLSGKEAVLRTHQAITRGNDYSVYIIDWLMPDMNGIEVARRIRKKTGEKVPIIVLTAYDWSDIQEEAMEAGVTAFCSKPLFFSELQSCLHSIVGKEEEAQSGEDGKALRSRTERILLAEDNDLNQEIAKAILEDAGFSVEIAENGKIAVDMLAASQPGYYQLVLMDVQMPEMDGYEATKVIRQMENKELADIPILAMTANAFEEDKKEAIKSGMNGHLAKPINIEKLLDTLDKMLG